MQSTGSYKQLESGIVVPYYYSKKPKKPIAFDFFSGCGGFGLGLIQAGFEVVGANEFDGNAAMTYMVNLGSYPINIHYIEGEKDKEKLNKAIERCWGIRSKKQKEDITSAKPFRYEGIYNKIGSGLSGSGWIKHYPEASPVRNFWFGDIKRLTGKDILDTLGLKQGDIDLVTGGPPCQGFSKAGKQEITDPRNNLIYEYARMIVELQPKTFVMEEVPDIVNFFDLDGVPVLDKFCLILQDGGYGRQDMIKKSIEMQTGAAIGLKGVRGGKSKAKTKKKEVAVEQISFL